MRKNIIEIKKIIDETFSKKKKINFVYGFEDSNKTRFIQNFFEYLDNEKTIPTWPRSNELSTITLMNDIKNIVYLNLTIENYVDKSKSPFVIKKEILKAKKEFDSIFSIITDTGKTQKTKLLWPILNTISSFGISLGVPLLSLAFYRTEALIQLVGKWFYYFLIIICVCLILFALSSTLFYLSTVIKTNKYETKNSNQKNILDNYIKKWFNVKKNKKQKFNLITEFNILYSNTLSNELSQNKIDLLIILNDLSNNLFVPVEIKNQFEIKLISNKYTNDIFFIMNAEQIKLKSYDKQVFDFLHKMIDKIFGIKLSIIFKKDDVYQNALRRFSEKSTQNYQLLKFLNYTKQFYGVAKANDINNKKIQQYCVNILVLAIYKLLSPNDYNLFEIQLSNKYIVSDAVKKTLFFNSLKIEQLLITNISLFNNESFVFHIDQILYDPILLDNIFKNLISPNKKYTQAETLVKNNNFKLTKSIDNNQNIYIDENENIISVYKINNANAGIFDEIQEIMNINLNSNIDYCIIEFVEFKQTLVFEKIIDEFDVNPNLFKI